jgi:hypothetical protein
MFDKIKKLFSANANVNSKPDHTRPEPPPLPPKKPRKPREKKPVPPKLTEKETATKNGEPYVSILRVEVDPNNINSGAFELDWNDKFVLNLIKSGYKQREDDTDATIVDRWFQTVCRNIALEVYEQQAADPKNPEYDDLRRVQRRDLGGGRSEVS